MPDQSTILGVRLTDPTRAKAVEAEMAALAQRHGLELVKQDSVSQLEFAELQQKLDSAVAEVERYRADIEALVDMSHELRTLQSPIIGYSELLMEYRKEKSDVEDKEEFRYIERIRGASQQLLALVSDFIAFTSLESDRLTLYPETFKFIDLINDVKKTAETYSKMPKELDVSNTLSIGEMHSDIRRVLQILFNILTISFRASTGGKIALLLSDEILDDLRNVRFHFSAVCTDNFKLEWAFDQGIEWLLTERLCQFLGGNVTKLRKETELEIIVRLPTNLTV